MLERAPPPHELLAEAERRGLIGASLDIFDGLIPEQRAVAEDQSKKIEVTCSRRAGKTTGLGRILIKSSQRAKELPEDELITGYLCPTKGQAKRLMWGRLQSLAKRYRIPYVFNSTELIARHPNGHQIWIMGADKDRDIDKVRGFSYYKFIIDEAQAVGRHMEDLIEEAIEPGLGDWDGQLILAGTPNAACTGYFHDAATGEKKGYSHHAWTIRHNYMFPRWRNKPDWKERVEVYLKGVRDEHNWDEGSSTYIREYLGLWLRDIGGLVYRYDDAKNTYRGDVPEVGTWHYILGIDLGFDDAFATEVIGYREHDPVLYEIDAFKKQGLVPSQWSEHIRALIDRYGRFDAIVMDTGGLGKAIAMDMVQRFRLPLRSAEKSQKNAAIELLNGDLRGGVVKIIHSDSPKSLMSEWKLLQWDENHKYEDKSYQNHLSDAFLYAYREAKHWRQKPAIVNPEPGSAAAMKRWEEKYWKEQLDKNERLGQDLRGQWRPRWTARRGFNLR
jgi:hypothetical protein